MNMQEWQPIETAPKDGSEIVLWWAGKVVTGFYLDNSKSEYPWQGFRLHSMVPMLPGKPTLWQSLPPAPELTVAMCNPDEMDVDGMIHVD